MWLIKKIGSITFTIWISIILMILLIGSTSFESVYGTTVVQNAFYKSKWFDLFLSLLWLNIFCSIIPRYPFKKHHVGFLLTHAGILGLLLGALLTRMMGVEGQVALYEGQRTNQLDVGTYELVVNNHDGPSETRDLIIGSNRIDLFTERSIDIDLELLDNAVEIVKVVPAQRPVMEHLGVEIEVMSRDLALEKTFWLTERHPTEPHPKMAMVGPVKFSLTREMEEDTQPEYPLLLVQNTDGEELAAIDLSGDAVADVDLGQGMAIRGITYYSHARVGHEGVIDHPQAGPMNPAVAFDVVGPNGESVHMLKFAYFPDFESMHGKAKGDEVDLVFDFTAPMDDHPAEQDHGMLVNIIPDEGQQATYQLKPPGGEAVLAKTPAGKWVDTGWMGLRFRVKRMLDHVDFESEVINADSSKQGSFAAHLVIRDGDQKEDLWFSEGQKVGYRYDDNVLAFQLRRKSLELPFYLSLKDFRKHDYPGTNRPAAYESDVELEDEVEQISKGQEISMNNPMDYAGFRIFQSSYVQHPEYGEASIFTVSKNPGIPFIYLSSCFIFGGASYQFFGKPNGRRKKRKKGHHS